MSDSETVPPSPNPYAPAALAAPFDRWRWLLAGVIGILGGYITLSLMNSGLIQALSGLGGYPPEITVQFVAQAVFGLAVASFAFLVAPGPLGRRLLAVLIFVVVVIVLVFILIGRINGSLRLPGPGALVVLNPYWVVLFAGGLGWLLAAGARPLAYLTLAATLVVMPLGYVFAMNNISSGIGTVVQLALALVIAVGILFASRPATSYGVATATPAAAPQTASELAPNAFVAMEEGAEADDGPRTPAA